MTDGATPLQIAAQLEEVNRVIGSTIAFIPSLIAAIIILIIGWILGRLFGRLAAEILDRIGVDDLLRRTAVGAYIEKSGIRLGRLFDLIVRWFIYLIAILAAISLLQIGALTAAVAAIVAYIPNIVAFILILVIGIILIDWFVDLFRGYGESQNIEFVGPIALGLRAFLYFVIVILALEQLLLDLTIIYVFLVPLAWGLALGLGAAVAIIVGFGLKDRAPQMMDAIMGRVRRKE